MLILLVWLEFGILTRNKNNDKRAAKVQRKTFKDFQKVLRPVNQDSFERKTSQASLQAKCNKCQSKPEQKESKLTESWPNYNAPGT